MVSCDEDRVYYVKTLTGVFEYIVPILVDFVSPAHMGRSVFKQIIRHKN